MIRRLSVLSIVAVAAIASAQMPSMPALPPLPANLNNVCLGDSAYLPYYQLILDTLKTMDTSGRLSNATVVANCDTVKVVIPLGMFSIPVFVAYTINACSLGLMMVDPTAQGGIRDSVINVCSLPVRQGVAARGPSVRGLRIERNGGSFVAHYASSAPVSARIATAAGRTVRVLSPAGGAAVWDGRTAAGSPAPEGLYVCIVKAGGTVESITFRK